MTDKEVFMQFQIESFLRERGLYKDGSPDLCNINMDDIQEMAKMFLEYVWVNGRSFLGVGGWLLWKDGCLLQEWFNEAKKHEGEKASDVPELVRLNKSIEEFEKFTKLYLGFGRNDKKEFVEL